MFPYISFNYSQYILLLAVAIIFYNNSLNIIGKKKRVYPYNPAYCNDCSTAAYISGTENAFDIFISGNAICHILTYNICSVNYCP